MGFPVCLAGLDTQGRIEQGDVDVGRAVGGGACSCWHWPNLRQSLLFVITHKLLEEEG